jgi:hypothetical protein
MIAAAERGRSVVPVLGRLCPYVYRQIVRDHRYPQLFSYWGRAVNFDENVRQTIVHPAILRGIGELAGVPMAGRIVHAGLQHTYGYLFSVIETPYGFKRDRWITTDMEKGFGIDVSLLGERPKVGTLLANLAYFLGRIVLCFQPRRLRGLEGIASAVATELTRYDYSRLQTRRLVLFTDMVPYVHPPRKPNAESTLLIYSVQRGLRARAQLLTAFPVTPAAVKEITAHVPTHGEICLRYNAYVRGLYGRTVIGQRYFADPRAHT